MVYGLLSMGYEVCQQTEFVFNMRRCAMSMVEPLFYLVHIIPISRCNQNRKLNYRNFA